MFGLLNVNKPSGLTSRQVVNHVQRVAGIRKVGHAGTLDPLATGVLVVCLGPATRLVAYVQKMRKRYRGTFLLGRSSPSDDIETDLNPIEHPPVPEMDQIRAVLPQFKGIIQQRPPEYSAIKVGGRRAYDMARQGQAVTLSEREVTVYELDIVDYTYPELTLDICCGAGTYVRSLGRDIAMRLGTAAVMSALTRSAIGNFRIDGAVDLEQVEADSIAQQLLPPSQAVAELPGLELTEHEIRDVANGRSFQRANMTESPQVEVAAFHNYGQLLAILSHRGNGKLSPVRVFLPGQAPALP